jgi:predicted DNA-binding transcriptional regulator AlpA
MTVLSEPLLSAPASAILCLTNGAGYTIISMKTYSTIQVARLLKIASGTFHRWIREKRVEAPPGQTLGGMQVRLWTEEDIERVRKYKADHYWGRGSRKKRKKKNK